MANLPSTYVYSEPNWRPYGWYNNAGSAASTASSAGGLGNTFARIKSGFSNAKGVKSAIPKQGAGLKIAGKNISTGANLASGVLYGAKALKGISDYNKVLQSNDDLMSDIRTSAMGNPLLSSYLTSDQLNLLRQIKSGAYDDSAGLDDFAKGAMRGLGDAILPILIGGVTGRLPGAIIAGVGSLANSGIDNLSKTSSENTSELQALYQALQDAEMQYKSMKRPNFTGLGIQQQYQNMYA